MNKVCKIIFGIVILMSLLCLPLIVEMLSIKDYSETNEDAGYTINYKSGFYTHSISLRIKSEEDAVIFYTLDGTSPSKTDETSKLYKNKISLKISDASQIYHVKFRLYDEADNESEIFDYSYFLGKESKRFSTYVVHISGDPDDLFGYENGIFVEGKLRDDYLAANPDITEAYNMDPANYNLRGEASERAVNVQIFDQKGTELLKQNCGLRIFGNYSRGKEQKSFQLFARTAYDVEGKFHVDLFPTINKQTDGTLLNKSNRLVFRNSGNDFGQAFVRDTLVQDLAGQLGFPLTTPYVSAAVYINDTYYGFYWIKEPFSNGYMESVYGEYDGTFEKVSINEFYKTAEDETEVLAKEYQELYDTYSSLDLNVDAHFESLKQLVDLDNYLQYYAIELYIANKDWPYNNVRAYRYVSDTDVYTPGTIFDGRYRYLLFDTDYAFGLSDDAEGFKPDEDNISILLNNEQSALFCNLMHREDCREKFVTYMCDLMNDAFAYENLKETLTKICEERDSELNYYVSHKLTDVTTIEGVAAATSAILTFNENRAGCVQSFLENDYAMFHPYTLTVTAPASAAFSVNSIEYAGENGLFTGTYYGECDLTLKAKIDSGHKFAYWLVNGTKYTEEALILPSDSIMQYQTLNVELVQTDNENALPVISSMHVKGSNDVITILNPSEHDISLNGYYLSDDENELQKSKLPNRTLRPGESIDFCGRGNILSHSGSQDSLTFNLAKFETLYFSSKDGTILEAIHIPDMTYEDSFYSKNLYTGIFTEQR